MDAGDLLDDGKPQPGAAGGLAAAFVHPVEPLKDAALGLFGDADAVVLHREIGVALPGAAGLQQDPAPGPVVADGVVAQVLAELFQQAGGALNLGALAPEIQGDVGPTGVHLQALGALPRDDRQVHRLHHGGIVGAARGVQMGQLDDVVHQPQHPAGLAVDLLPEGGHVLGPGQPGLDHLGVARNAGQRRLELVAHVGRELPPQAILPVVLGVEILHLPPDLPVLLRQTPHHGLELVLHVPLVGAGEVDSV